MTTANDWMRELEAELNRADGALLQSVREKVLGSPENEQDARDVLVEVQGIKTNVVKVARLVHAARLASAGQSTGLAVKAALALHSSVEALCRAVREPEEDLGDSGVMVEDAPSASGGATSVGKDWAARLRKDMTR